MSIEGTTGTTGGGQATGARPPAAARAMSVVLRVLAALVFAQAVFAGLFLDGESMWRDWHSFIGMTVLPLLTMVQVVLAILVWRPGRGPAWPAVTSVALLVAVVLQSALGQASLLAVHVPLGVAILGLLGTLIGRTQTLTRVPATR